MRTFVACSLALLLVAAVLAQQSRQDSECETWRKRELARSQPIPGGITPECEANGDFKALQCHDQRWCQCWRPNGEPITQASTKIRRCECIRERDAAGARPGAFTPNCHENGTYHPRQCWASTGMCWCADHQGNKLNEPTRDRTSLPCN